jgi:hypothetical protein
MGLGQCIDMYPERFIDLISMELGPSPVLIP